ncbi:hypothetical protein Pa4123_42520 [Phytohabitans aurantiacus]|uniref:Methyltransferase n=2 Tax=Phytohabitans aurantiacus TaxID=3016789 RepID=A0ABQ5QY54_9ACTN|nr:hypothetical protein Pa4123_42520 [Phytohabitans aurantiacus]
MAVHSGGVAPMTDVKVRRENDQHPWDRFDSEAYFKKNYASMRDDDRQILQRMAQFFSSRLEPGPRRYGLDVGPGTNLYPALTMLPFCESIFLWERSLPNITWLRAETEKFRPSWDAFWGQLNRFRKGRAQGDPRLRLARSARLCRGSIFDLPVHSWDMGTMFFVAESITSDYVEFREATQAFVRSLKPGAPFVAAFMEESKGYRVGSYDFPAVPVTIDDIRECLSDVADSTVERIISDDPPLRDGYSGMLLALGQAR